MYINFILNQQVRELSCHLNGSVFILGKATPIRKEVLHHKIKLISQICINLQSCQRNQHSAENNRAVSVPVTHCKLVSSIRFMVADDW